MVAGRFAPGGHGASRRSTTSTTSQIALVDVASGESRDRGRRRQPRHGRAMGAGRVAHLPQRRRRLVPGRPPLGGRARPDRLTEGEREHGEPSGGYRLRAAALAGWQARRAHRGPRRPRSTWSSASSAVPRRRSAVVAGHRRRRGPCSAVDEGHDDLAVGGRLASDRVAARRGLGRRDRGERDAAAGPVAAAGPGRRAGWAHDRDRSPTRGPRCSRRRCTGSRVPRGERVAITARDGLRIEGTLWRPATATGQARRPSASRRSSTRTAARRGRPIAIVPAVQAAARQRGLRVPRRRFPGLDRLRPRVPPGQPRRMGPCRYPRHDRCRAGGPPSSRGRTGGSRSSAGRTAATWSCAPLVEEPSLWSAGVDLYGDSEIAESFRHGDRSAGSTCTR